MIAVCCLQYRSPEECADGDDLNHKADVYSFGHVLLNLLAGTIPYDHYDNDSIATNKTKLRDLIVTRKELPTAALVSAVTRQGLPGKHPVLRYIAVINKCYTYDPRKRPNAFEIAKDLKRIQRGVEKALTEAKKEAHIK